MKNLQSPRCLCDHGEKEFDILALEGNDDFIIITHFERVVPEAKIKQWMGMPGLGERNGI